MSKLHARRRLRERLPGIKEAQVIKAIHNTRGRASSPICGIKTHLIYIDGKAIKAVFDWRQRQLVTVILASKEVYARK